MELSAQAYKRRYEQAKRDLLKLKQEQINKKSEFEFMYINKLRNEYTFSLEEITIGSEWYDKQTNEYIGSIVEITNHPTHPYLMTDSKNYHPDSILLWFRLKDK